MAALIRLCFILLFIPHLVYASVNAGQHSHHHALLQDRAVLLQFKKSIIDLNSKLQNWEEVVPVCNFTGVTCDELHQRVIKLNLTSFGLVGTISPLLSNLTSLRLLSLAANHFSSGIPPELSSLRHLKSLLLHDNNLSGPLPDSLGLLHNLTVFVVAENNLSGPPPYSFFSNCTKLKVLDLSSNSFNSRIPSEIGNSPNLWSLNLYNNQFTGQLPVSLANTSLCNLDVDFNLLSGELPSELVRNLPKLCYLHLSYNRMTSHDSNTNLYPFFAALRNCSTLYEVELVGMRLGGMLPSSIGHPNISNLNLQDNQIFGSIPCEIGNLPNLRELDLSFNFLNGTIPEEVGRLSKLQRLYLSTNFFNIRIPVALGKLPHLGLIDLSNNKFFGEIPDDFGDLVLLNTLLLNNNLLSGKIPKKLLKSSNLYQLDLSYNKLTGRIPHEIAELREIRIFINFSHNILEGPLPVELSKLNKVLQMDFSSNNLSGNIFPQISSCSAAEMINFSNNAFVGQLPNSFGELRNLKSFDVSNNSISGVIPSSLSKINLTFLNLSCNNFEGMIPTGGIFNSTTSMSFLGNPHLCGATSSTTICPKKKHWFRSRMFVIIFIIVIVVSVILSAICCAIGIRKLKLMVSSRNTKGSRKLLTTTMVHNFPRISYRELQEATEGFDNQKLIGIGSYGRVYRGVLHDGTNIAVKVLYLQSANSTKSFNRECQVLKRIRHRNLIRIITACSLPDFKALVLPYMANGSLDSCLYPPSGSSNLSLLQRVNICSDIAEGMAYLHHHSPIRVIHCDLKPSNVLLNDDMTALISDFGIARLVMTASNGAATIDHMGNSTADMLTGSIGYIAPEYGFGSSASTKGDVYSFGVLVLEIVTRKRPTDDMFVGGLNLHKWVKSQYHGRVDKVVDSSLIRASKNQSIELERMWEVAVVELIELGILCTQETPSTRPTMLDAADDLDRLKRYLNGDTTTTFTSSHGISSSTLDDY